MLITGLALLSLVLPAQVTDQTGRLADPGMFTPAIALGAVVLIQLIALLQLGQRMVARSPRVPFAPCIALGLACGLAYVLAGAFAVLSQGHSDLVVPATVQQLRSPHPYTVALIVLVTSIVTCALIAHRLAGGSREVPRWPWENRFND